MMVRSVACIWRTKEDKRAQDRLGLHWADIERHNADAHC